MYQEYIIILIQMAFSNILKRRFMAYFNYCFLQWRHDERDGVSNHRRLDYLLNRLFRRRSKKTSKLRITGLCETNSPVTDEFPAQRASNSENASFWWLHHVFIICVIKCDEIMDSWQHREWVLHIYDDHNVTKRTRVEIGICEKW